MFKHSQKELMALAEPEKDCVPAPGVDVDEEDEWQTVGAAQTAPTAVEWPWAGRPKISGRAGLVWIEKIALAVESLCNKLTGAQTLNPFYHTGTISVFLLILVALTGLYLTVFYIAPGLGTDHAYEAVAALDRHWLWLGRIMRGAHRYASGAALIATFFHALRTLFQDRFRGARWLAWVTGMLMLGALWLEGLSGYWLVWDERSQLILDTVLKAIGIFPSVGVPYALDFLTNEATAQIWIFFLLLLFAHIALFTVIGLFYWFHVLRLGRAKFLPPPFFMIAFTVIMVAAAVALPATSAAKADLSKLPGQLTIDPFYLFYLPATLRANPAYFWGATLAIFALVTAVPWLLRGGSKQPGKVVIDKDICTGCTNCANDCPYNAIVMMPRTDGKPHQLVAIENPTLCVSCGVCIGSCDGRAVSLADLPVTPYYESIIARVRAARERAGAPVKVTFTCERRAAHQTGSGKLSSSPAAATGPVEVITMPCVSVLNPNLAVQAIEAGASEVDVMGCPPDDCAQREGNLWMEARLDRTRAPRLKRNYADLPIYAAWSPPNESAPFHRPAAEKGAPPKKESALSLLKFSHFIRGGLLLAVVTALQAAITNVQYQPFGSDESLLQVGMRNEGGMRQETEVLTGPELAQLSHDEQVEYLNKQQAEGRFPTRLRLEIDGQVALDDTYRALGLHQEGSAFALERFFLPSGQHTLSLSMDDSGGELKTVIEQTTDFAPGQIHALVFNRVTNAFELK